MVGAASLLAVSPSSVLVLTVVGGAIAVGALGWALHLRRRLAAEGAAVAELRAARRWQEEEIEKAHESMRATLETERELIELKARFVSLVSHEFRTPLGIITSAGQLLQNYRDRLGPEKQHELLGDILGATRHMASLMEQVLLLGRTDVAGAAIAQDRLDLPALLAQLCAEQRQATGDRCPITLALEGDLSSASGDAGLLRHIFANLLSNAVKYSPPGREIRLGVRREADRAVCTVADQGIGIPAEDLPRLFEAFHRAANVGETPGSGLGLLIVKRCVELHGGRIDVRSRLGEGTTFTVDVPVFAAHSGGGADAGLAPPNIPSRIAA